MSIIIPARPGPTAIVHGTPGTAEGLATRLTDAANVVEGQQDFASGPAIGDVGGHVWSGRGADAYLGAIAPFSADTSTACTGLNRGAKALHAYGDELTKLRSRHTTLDETRGNLTQAITNFEAEVTSWEGKEIPDETVEALTARSAELTRQVNTYTTDNTALHNDIQSNEKTLVTGLTGYAGVTSTGTTMKAQGYNPAQLIRSGLDKVAPGAHPQDLATIPPDRRARWWASLTPAEKEAAAQEFPEYLGSGNGLPAAVRDTANRQNLDRDLARSRAVMATSPAGSDQYRAAEKTLGKALGVQKAMETGSEKAHGAPVQLYAYDANAFGGDGKAVISIGDLDHAKNVAWNVPGMTTDITSAADNMGGMANLYNEAHQRDPSVASVLWIGYDAPSGSDVGAVTAPGAAHDGGNLLASDIKGFASARDQLGLGQGSGANDHLNLSVIGHSYGSTTVSWAGHEGRLAGDVDTVTLIGSPGAGGVNSAAEFGVDHVYVGSSSNDPVTHLGSPLSSNTTDVLRDAVGSVAAGLAGPAGIPMYNSLGHPDVTISPGALGADPATTAFGADRFRAEGGDASLGIGSHTSYYQNDTDSLRNLGAIVSGDDNVVTHEYRRSTNDVISGWRHWLQDDPAVTSREKHEK